MKYNFDKVINRNQTDSIKYEFREKVFGTANVMPLWVADMDFEGFDKITEAIINRANHSIYGYSVTSSEYYSSVSSWCKKRYNWQIEDSWIINIPNVVAGIKLAIQTFTEVGDKIIVQSPVYYPFYESVTSNKRSIIDNKLHFDGSRYSMNFKDLEAQIDNKTKMLILCNPHNPVGRVWKKDELEKLAAICIKNNILVLADEIHSDLIFKGYHYIPFAQLSKEISALTITLNSPSKTFNIAGLSTANVIIENENLKQRYQQTLLNAGHNSGNIFGMEALKAGYKYGDEWVNQLVEYLEDNYNFLNDYLISNLPKIELIKAEGLYLAWLNCTSLRFKTQGELVQFFIQDAKLGLNNGTIFGDNAQRFMRLNYALPRAELKKALLQLKTAYDYNKF